MGTFLMMSGVAGTDIRQVEASLRDFAAQRSGSLVPLASGETAEPDSLLLMAEAERGNITVVYPHFFLHWDAASQYLSASLHRAVFSLHIHDGDLWMYRLFADGQEVDRFNPIPDYWDVVTPEEAASWSGDAAAICRYWPGVTVGQVEKYLVRWEPEGEEDQATAYPDDAAGTGAAWQIVDFMESSVSFTRKMAWRRH